MKKLPQFTALVGLIVSLLWFAQVNSSVIDADSAPPSPLERINGFQYRSIPHLSLSSEAVQAEPQAAFAPNVLIPWGSLVFQSLRDDNWEIYTGKDDGSAQTRRTFHDAADIHPRLNRGADRIVFASNRTGSYEIYVMNFDGSGLVQLTFTGADNVNPVWSPDGRKIAFESYRHGQADIYVMEANGANQTRLTAVTGFDGMPSWSPDGGQIAFASNRSGSYQVWRMNADGSAPQRLTWHQAALYPAWSPDGGKIAYSASDSNDSWLQIWTMNADGSAPRLMTAYLSQTDEWARGWSPDGHWVVYTHVHFVQYQGQWYWNFAYPMAVEPPPFPGVPSTWSLSNDGRDWHPDWQPTDALPPVSTMSDLPRFSRAPGVVLSWSSADVGPAGIGGYDIQYRLGDAGDWIDWLVNAPGQQAIYTGDPGQTVYFRGRARDRAHNVEGWSESNSTFTTLYSHRALVRLTNNRGVPLEDKNLIFQPPPIDGVLAERDGVYRAYFGAGDTHTLNLDEVQYASLPSTQLDSERMRRVYLPPLDNIIQNGSFEEAGQQPEGWIAGGAAATSVVSNVHNTGNQSLLINFPCSFPCLDPNETIASDSPYRAYDIATDSQGNLHMIWDKTFDGVYHRYRAPNGVWLNSRRIFSYTGSTHQARPHIAVDGQDTLHATWSYEDKIYYSWKPAAGQWAASVVVADANGGDAKGIAADSQGSVHIVYHHHQAGVLQLYHLEKSPFGGWNSPVLIGVSVGYSYTVFTVGRDDSVHLFWRDRISFPRDALFYRRRQPGGQWQETTELYPNATHTYAYPRAIVADEQGGVHLFWGRAPLYYGRSSDGNVWEPFTSMSQNIEAISGAFDAMGFLHTVSRFGSEAYYRRLAPDGEWSTVVNLTPTGAIGISPPSIAIDPFQNAHIVLATFDALLYRTRKTASASGEGVIQQTITIPNDMLNPTLSFMYLLYHAVPGDGSELAVYAADDFAETKIFSGEAAADWTQGWVDMTAWQGQTITLTFAAAQQADAALLSLYLDDISLGSSYPDLVIYNSGSTAALPGEQLTLAFSYENRGGVSAADVRLMLTLPDKLAFVEANLMPATTEPFLTWEVGDLAAQSGRTVIMVTASVLPTAVPFETFVAPATISSATPELEIANNSVEIGGFIGRRNYFPILVR